MKLTHSLHRSRERFRVVVEFYYVDKFLEEVTRFIVYRVVMIFEMLVSCSFETSRNAL